MGHKSAACLREDPRRRFSDLRAWTALGGPAAAAAAAGDDVPAEEASDGLDRYSQLGDEPDAAGGGLAAVQDKIPATGRCVGRQLEVAWPDRKNYVAKG